MKKWKFKSNAEPQGTSDGFWYDLTSGGYIKPEEILENNEQLEELNKAIDIVSSFEKAMLDSGLVEEF